MPFNFGHLVCLFRGATMVVPQKERKLGLQIPLSRCHTIMLPEALSAWNTEAFVATLKREVEALEAQPLHLDRCQNGYGVLHDGVTVILLGATDRGSAIEARIAILYTVTETAYCCPVGPVEQSTPCHVEMMVRIDKATAGTTFTRDADRTHSESLPYERSSGHIRSLTLMVH